MHKLGKLTSAVALGAMMSLALVAPDAFAQSANQSTASKAAQVATTINVTREANAAVQNWGGWGGGWGGGFGGGGFGGGFGASSATRITRFIQVTRFERIEHFDNFNRFGGGFGGGCGC